jgi:hypothetical protein
MPLVTFMQTSYLPTLDAFTTAVNDKKPALQSALGTASSIAMVKRQQTGLDLNQQLNCFVGNGTDYVNALVAATPVRSASSSVRKLDRLRHFADRVANSGQCSSSEYGQYDCLRGG